MEDTLNHLTHFFLKDGDSLRNRVEDNILCHAVVYEDVQDLIRMKTEYEAVKYIRRTQSFDQNFSQKVGLIWLGNYKIEHLCFSFFHSFYPFIFNLSAIRSFPRISKVLCRFHFFKYCIRMNSFQYPMQNGCISCGVWRLFGSSFHRQ